jgi:hypothetical protein
MKEGEGMLDRRAAGSGGNTASVSEDRRLRIEIVGNDGKFPIDWEERKA